MGLRETGFHHAVIQIFLLQIVALAILVSNQDAGIFVERTQAGQCRRVCLIYIQVFHPGINILVVSTGKRIAQCLFIDRKKRFQSHLLGGIDSIYKTEIIVVSHRHFLFLVGTLRGDKYHTCRRTGTVNGRR